MLSLKRAVLRGQGLKQVIPQAMQCSPSPSIRGIFRTQEDSVDCITQYNALKIDSVTRKQDNEPVASRSCLLASSRGFEPIDWEPEQAIGPYTNNFVILFL